MKNIYRHAGITCLALVAGFAASAASAQQRLAAVPQAPAWTLGQRFVTALNGYDRQALEIFLADVLSPAALRQQPVRNRALDLLRARRQLGAVEIVDASGVPHALVFNVRSKAPAVHAGGAEIIVVMETDSGRADEIVLIPGHFEP